MGYRALHPVATAVRMAKRAGNFGIALTNGGERDYAGDHF
jgi:hypothetical protein